VDLLTWRAFSTELLQSALELDKTASQILVPVDVIDLKARKKKPGKYQDARDYTMTGLKGALIGGSATKLVEKLRGNWGKAAKAVAKSGKVPEIGPKGYLAAATLGAGAAMADRYYRHREAKKQGLIKAAFGKTPGERLQQNRQTGSFRDEHIHTGVRPPAAAGTFGKSGRLPKL